MAAADDLHPTGADFLAALSRELRGPLRGMARWLTLLIEARRDPELIDRAVRALELALQQQTQLADDLLVLAHLATGRLPLVTSTVDIVDRVRASVERHRPQGRQQHIDLTLDAPATPLLVSGDERRLDQVLDRLLDQTLAGAAAGRPVTTSVRAVDGRCEIEISAAAAADSPADALDGDPGLLPEVRDAALGVVLANHVVEAHGGAIDVAAGRRPAFRVRLPRLADDAAAARRPPQLLERLRILIVDDDDTSREALAEALNALGADAAIAPSVLDALARLAAERFDAVCSDIEMPGDSGFVLAQAIRAGERDGVRQPLIAISGVMDEPHAAAARAAGFDACLPKPIDVGRLARCMRALSDGVAADQFERNSPTVPNEGT